MFDRVSIGVRDASSSKGFSDAILSPLGYRCLGRSPGSLGYGRDVVAFWVNEASRPVPPDRDSGLHFCFSAPTRDAVAAFHAAAPGAGGMDNGGPGLRPDYCEGYYAAFVVIPTATVWKPIAANRPEAGRISRSRSKRLPGPCPAGVTSKVAIRLSR